MREDAVTVPPAPFERIDMAFFAAAPGFVRASIRLHGVDGRRAVAPAKSLLAKAARDPRAPATEGWQAAYAALGLPPETVAPVAALGAWAARPGGVPSQGPLADIVHATSLRLGLVAAVYDLDGVQGGLWLRPARGVEVFEGLPAAGEESARPESVPINEPVLTDSAERCLARAWHGAQSSASYPTLATRDALVHLDAIDGDRQALAADAEALARLLTGFLGGVSRLRLLTRQEPSAVWSD
jgi:DNA/RNA-binding domain of Phe-tRNA-synthetase-like protein